jgi:hypothetical protein
MTTGVCGYAGLMLGSRGEMELINSHEIRETRAAEKIEMLTWREKLIAIFIRDSFSPIKTRFLTPLDEPLQCGIGIFKKGAVVEPHRHVGIPATVTEFQEFIYLKRGFAIAEVYDPEGKLLSKIEMRSGDALLLLRGGHAFYFQEDSEILEVKQGPYLGREMMKQPLGTQ